MMPWVSLALSAIFGVLGVLARFWIHWRSTGRLPVRSGQGPSGWFALVGVAALVSAAPTGELVFGLNRLTSNTVVAALGIGVASLGLGFVLWGQASMGPSLRVGVDPNERTALVTAGVFGWVRNPIYSAMACYVAGTALMVPNALGMAAFMLIVIVLELQVRRIEEPYLVSVHGDSYIAYASRVGRFVPLLGRFRSVP